jgi:nitrogenase-stabilizing/protective protein
MQDLIARLKALSSAEDFLGFFGIEYEQRVVHVNRLHILKRFYQYLRNAEGLAALDDVGLFRRYRECLEQAYQDFVHSTAQREKVFKVFQDAQGQQSVPLASLRDSLAERRHAEAA